MIIKLWHVSMCLLPSSTLANYLLYYPLGKLNQRGGGNYGWKFLELKKRILHVRDWSVKLFTVHIPIWRRTCMHSAGKWIWHSKIGSGMLLVNFRTLMLLEHPQTYAHTCGYTQTLLQTYAHHTHTQTHLLLIPLFSSLFRLLSSLNLPSQAAKLSPEQLNNH